METEGTPKPRSWRNDLPQEQVEELMEKLSLHHENTADGEYNLVTSDGEVVGMVQRTDREDPSSTENVQLTEELWSEFDK